MRRKDTRGTAMKIYRFTDLAGHSRTGTAGAHAAYRQNQKHGAAPSGNATDLVEISTEARQRFERARVTEIDRARIRKLAAESDSLARRMIELEDDIPSRIRRRLSLDSVREAVWRGEYDFDGDAVLRDTAFALSSQFFRR